MKKCTPLEMHVYNVLVGHSFGGVIIKALVAATRGFAAKTIKNNVEFQEVLKCKFF